MDDTRTLSRNGKAALTADVDQTAPIGDEGRYIPPDLAIQIRCAAALGWAITELLGRCYLIATGYHKPLSKPSFSTAHHFSTAYPVLLSPVLDPMERIRAVTGRIAFLAKRLGVDTCKIEEGAFDDISEDAIMASITDSNAHASIVKLMYQLKHLCCNMPQGQEDETYTLVDVLDGLVTLLSSSTQETPSDKTYEKNVCIIINALLFYWGESIQVALQEDPPVVYNAYTIGRGFATIRWYIGIGKAKQAPEQDTGKRGDKLVTPDALNKLRDHLQSMSSYLPPFVAEALDYSLDIWGRTIIDNIVELNEAIEKDRKHGPVKCDRDKYYERMRIALIKQSMIWHDLLTGERDPTTYVKPRAITREYVRRLFAFAIPFIVLGLILAFVIAFAIVHVQDFLQPSMAASSTTKAGASSSQSMTDNTISDAITTIVTAAATLPIIRALWLSASKTTTNLATTFVSKHPDAIYGQINTSGKDALHLFWQQSQQVAINKATYLSPKPSLFHRIFPFLREPEMEGDGDDGD